MTEVSSRGAGLPRAGPQRARGRGRGAFNNPAPNHFGPSSISIDYKLNGHRSHPQRFSDLHSSSSPDEPEELKSIRKKHGQKLSTIKELFPSWTDEDLLMALNEAAGDLELAAARISEGLTEQWGSVKTKKDKKITGAQQASTGRPSHPLGLGNGLDGRLARGRGDLPRGSSRVGGRGAAPRGTGRGQWATGSARPSHPLPTFEDSLAPTTTPSAWSLGPPASVLSNGNPTNVAPPDLSATLATIPDQVTQSPDLAHVTAAPSDSKLEDGNTIQESPNRAPDHSKLTPEPPKKPISRVIAPGTKMSWAQIARPADPPKPPQTASISQQALPVTASRPSASDLQSASGALIASSEPLDMVATPEVVPTDQLPDNQVTINIPDPTADVWHTEPVPAIDDIKPNLATAGPNVWNDDPVLQPLGVGEGWAETVLAQPSESKASIFDNQTATNLILTPSEAGNIGPIELAAPSAAPVLDPTGPAATSPEPNPQELNLPAAEPPVIRINDQPTPPPSNGSILAPPGLTKRASTRKGQEAAVVMPGSGTPNVDRIGLTFGSLRLYGEAIETSDSSQAPPLDVPSPPLPTIEEPTIKESSAKLEEHPIDKSSTPPQLPAEPAKSPSPPLPPPVMEEKVPFAAPTVNVNYNSAQSHPSAQPSPPQINHQSSQAVPHVPQPPPPNPQTAPPHSSAAPPQSSSFGSRYPSGNQYVAPEPSTVHQQGSISQAPQPQQPDAFSHYPGFRQDPMAVYFQQQQQQQQQQPQSAVAQHSSSPAPASQSPATYGSFNHMNPQVPQQNQQPAQAGFGQAPQSVPEYAALYGQEALRSLQQGYYDSYAHAQVAQTTFQSRSPHGGDDTAKSTIATQLATQGQPQQVAQHQHQHQHQHQQPQQQQPAGASASGASQQYPGMQPSPMPYPYYPYYQQYGQLPPNYQNPSYPYGLQGPSPYYQVQGSQQYPVAGGRAGQSQYPMQGGPGNSGTSGGGAVPNAHAHQQQHGAQHGLVVANSGGFRQVSQPGVGGSQIGGGQVAGQGVGGGNGLVPGTGGGMGAGQQGAMHQQQHYYGSGYYDPQAAGQQGPPQQSVSGGGAHHHHHHHSQQAQRQTGGHHHGHHHGQNQGGQQQQNVGGGAAGGGQGGPGAQGGQGSGAERKDPFTFSSDRFFNQ